MVTNDRKVPPETMSDALFTDEPAPEQVQFTDEPAPEEKSLAGFGRNAVQDVKENVTGTLGFLQKMSEHPVDTGVATVKALPRAIKQEGLRLGVGELPEHPINAIEKLGGALYDKPFTTATELLPAAGAIGKAGKLLAGGAEAATAGELGAEAAKAGEGAAVAEEAAEAAKAAATEAPKAPPAAEIPGTPPIPGPEAPPPPPPPVGGIAQDANKAWQEVKSYTNRTYENAAKKPGFPQDVADYMHRKSQDLAFKQLGGSPAQVRQVGEDGARAIAQYAMDNGIVDPKVGPEGMKIRTNALNDAAGKTLGTLRKEADALRNAAADPIDVLQQVRAKLDQKYARGAYSGDSGQYAKALEDVEDATPTHEGLAKLATKLNAAANEANKLKQPHGAFTDVANTVSHMNNERVKSLIGPAKAAQYEQALREFGVTKKIQEFLKRRGSLEVARRIGPGGPLREISQHFLDDIGYKAGAKLTNRMSAAALKNPGMTRSLPSMFKEFIHQVEELGTDLEGMAHGGVVAPEMADYVNSH